MCKTKVLSKLVISLQICTAAILLSAFSSNAVAQQSDRVAASLPAIICLLICEEEPATAPPSINAPSSSVSYSANSSITPLLFINSGGQSITSCTPNPALPAGLSVQVSANSNSCEIVGTPSASQPASSYIITAANDIGSDSATIEITIIEALSISLSGQITYDLVPTSSSPSRLDYNAIVSKPVRGAIVELLNDSNAVLQTSSTDELGNYSFLLALDATVRVRVRAQLLKSSGAAQYDVKIVDNTNANAIYALAEGSASLASDKTTRNLHAPSGWGGSAYTSTRASAPFAITDSIYEAITDFIAIDPAIIFPPLTVNWSINNVPVGGSLAAGQIGTSFYSNSNLYILGAANNDTDEFDDHVILHEWGHYFEDNLSRSDSIGGSHTGGDRLDMRVAFGEGFGNALSGMITDDPRYIDSSGSGQSSGFTINVETNYSAAQRGWYNESSVQSLLYDFYDSVNDGTDSISLGLSPIYNVLINEQKNSDTLTSIFSFASALKANNTGAASGIDALLDGQAIVSSTINEFGSTETNNAGNTTAVLPVYTNLVVGNTQNICFSNTFGKPNKLSNFRYLMFNVTSAGAYQLSMVRDAATTTPTDPDFRIIKKGLTIFTAESSAANSEIDSFTFGTGIHIIEINDFTLRQTGTATGQTCFDILVTSI